MSKVESQLRLRSFPNGLTLLAEPMPWLRSASFAMMLPAGCQYDPEARRGLASFSCDMIQRGCGERDARRFVEDLEMFGVNYGMSVSVYHTIMGGTVPTDNLCPTLEVFADVVKRPWLPEEHIEDSRMVCYQELRGIEDDLAQKAMLTLRMRHYGQPFGRNSVGTVAGVTSIAIDDIRRFCLQHYRPNEMIVSVAGNIDWPALQDRIGGLFADLPQGDDGPPDRLPAEHGSYHIPFESNQTHIGLAFPSVPYRDPNYYLARCAIGVMSDGMSSRLFNEVREKRGLCYTVSAHLHSLRDQACVMCYAGSSSDRAQETLDVIVEQFQQLREGVTAEELARLKVQIRSGLIMQQESSRARAASIASDWFHLHRVRSLEEVNATIDRIQVDEVNQFLRECPPLTFDVVTLGPEPLEVACGVL